MIKGSKLSQEAQKHLFKKKLLILYYKQSRKKETDEERCSQAKLSMNCAIVVLRRL